MNMEVKYRTGSCPLENQRFGASRLAILPASFYILPL